MASETGMVIMWTSDQPPTSDWLLCDGAPVPADPKYDDLRTLLGGAGALTPNMTDKFVRGAGATPIRTVGGRPSVALTVAEMPNHDHGGTTVAGEGGHNHQGTTTSTSVSLNHRHSGTSGNDSANHTHSIPSVNTGNVSAWHVHNVVVNEGNGDGDGGPYVDTNPSADGSSRPDVGVTNGQSVDHVHASVNIETGGVSANHAHAMTIYNTSIAHSHSGTSGAPSASHTHAISAIGSATPINLNPAHYALMFLIHR